MTVTSAAVLLATVISIADGDTLTALTADHQQIKVRIAAIDAPERGQPYGTRSRQSLAALCFKQQAEIQVLSRDQYGRRVAAVRCQGIDAGASQLQAGLAWVYTQYAQRFPDYPALQTEAKLHQRGLWAGPAPVAPWVWRHRQSQ